MIRAVEWVEPLPQTVGLQELRRLDLSDLPRWKRAVEHARSSGFGYYFPYVLTHQCPGRSAILITEDAGCLCIFVWGDRRGGPRLDLFLPPIPMDVAVARRCLERANDFNHDRSARIQRIDASDVERVASIPGLSVRERRAQYVYAPRAFGDLSGGKYRTLRRQVAKTRQLQALEVVPWSERFAGDCRTLLARWSRRHRDTFGTSGGARTSARALDLAGAIPDPDLVGEVVLLEERLVAFAFGGELRPGLGCFFEAKSDHDVPGLTYFQRYNFLSKLDAFERVNDGSDARRAGIRQLKDSLRPVAMHLEYRGSQV
jgi:hypothetical protein